MSAHSLYLRIALSHFGCQDVAINVRRPSGGSDLITAPDPLPRWGEGEDRVHPCELCGCFKGLEFVAEDLFLRQHLALFPEPNTFGPSPFIPNLTPSEQNNHRHLYQRIGHRPQIYTSVVGADTNAQWTSLVHGD
jgi:hypothetical protein